MAGGQFLTAGTTADNYSVQEIVPKQPADNVYEMADCDAVIQLLNDQGEAPVADFIYYLVPGSEAAGFDGAGWYTTSDNINYVKSTKTFSRGEGFIYSSPYAEDEDGNELPTSIQSAGEVNLEAKTLTFDYQGYWALANTRPLPVSVQKFVPTLSDEAVNEMGDCEAVVQLLNTDGEASVSDFIYYLVPGSGAAGFDGAGWYTTSDNVNYVKSTKEFSAGEGFIYMSAYGENEGGDEVETYLTIQK